MSETDPVAKVEGTDLSGTPAAMLLRGRIDRVDVRQAMGAEVGLSVSGVAGPSGGMPDKPIGTDWIGLSAEDTLRAWCFHFHGDRLQVKQGAAQKALRLLVDYLSD